MDWSAITSFVGPELPPPKIVLNYGFDAGLVMKGFWTGFVLLFKNAFAGSIFVFRKGLVYGIVVWVWDWGSEAVLSGYSWVGFGSTDWAACTGSILG